MKLLVFASTPPPVHGQSLMVRTLVEGLAAAAPDIEVVHVNPRLSRDAADIGRWRIGKFFTLLLACIRALSARARHGPMVFYYVPAPGKRSALYRDWLVLALCRPFFRALVLHWHAVGLGEWLDPAATPPERGLTRLLLGRAALALVLAPELAADAARLAPRRTAVVANGIADPFPAQVEPDLRADRSVPPDGIADVGPALAAAPGATRREEAALSSADDAPTEVLFLGLGSREKGLFDTLTALALANRRAPGRFRLTVAGGFASAADEAAFHSQASTLGAGLSRHVGFADNARKAALFAAADIFCFPTVYPHEGQPLALIEALAHDVPIVTTRWRAIPAMLPSIAAVQFVDPGRPDQIAAALVRLRDAAPPAGALRAHYDAHFTRERHLAALAAALRSLAR